MTKWRGKGQMMDNEHAAPNVPTHERTPAVAPALWNPDAAGVWSVFLTPIFGSILVLKNWQVLRDANQTRAGRTWLAASIATSLVTEVPSTFLPNLRLYWLSFLYIVLWYFLWQRKQTQYVKERWGKDYSRKGWAVPLSIGISAVLALRVLQRLITG